MPFPTTRWSLLAQATIHGDAAQREALAEFYRRYREPVVGFVRRQCRNPAEAEDLAHEFFLHLVENSTLQRADPQQGRFRSFLLGALLRFLERVRVRGGAAKRGGGDVPLSFDALQSGPGEPMVPADIAAAFDREWALGLIERVRQELEREWKGVAHEWTMLRQFLPGAADTPTYEAAASGLGWTQARLKTEVFRLRQAFRDQVRAEVALTVNAPHEIEPEMAYLHRILSQPAN